jgi:hypothetical protein
MTDTFRALCAELADSVELLLDMRQSARPLLITEDRLNRARAALAEQPRGFTPISVAERLPEPEDCDAEGRCWWLTKSYPPGAVFWELSRYSLASTHWLPANALPVPAND